MKVAVFTIGCKTNLYESQQIVAYLKQRGFEAALGLEKADVTVINTCAITKEAEKKSRQAVARARKLNEDCKVVIVGCAAEKDSGQFDDIDGVTFVKGVEGKEKIAEKIGEIGKDVEAIPSVYSHFIDAEQLRTRAFVKIQDGCDNFCSYCIVPYLRGRSRSKKIADVRREVQKAACPETVLIGIDISQYGRDNGESLAELFAALADVPTRVRLGSLEVRAVNEEMLTALQKTDFCPHFHLSLQSGCDSVLARMNRKYTTAQFTEKVDLIRAFFPEAALTTDVIVGFCGETEEEFAQTCDFVQKIGFADLHVFPYSRREGTAAYRLPDVPAKVKKERAETLSGVKRQLKEAFLQKQLGKTEKVVVEQKKNGYFEGYTGNYTKVYFTGNVASGETVRVRLVRPFRDGAEGTLV